MTKNELKLKEEKREATSKRSISKRITETCNFDSSVVSVPSRNNQILHYDLIAIKAWNIT